MILAIGGILGAAALSASSLACCLHYRRRLAAARKDLIAARITCEEQAAQAEAHRQAAESSDRERSRISEESQAALDAAIESLQTRNSEVQRWTEALPDAVVVHRSGTIVYANRSAQSLLESRETDMAGCHLAQWLGNCETNLREECTILRGDGTVFRLSVAERSIEFEGGLATLTLLRDLTQQRRIQRRLRLADRMTSLGSLVAGIAHELNNPMSYVLPNLAMLREDLDRLSEHVTVADGPLADLREMLVETEEGCMRISAIVGELQKFARPVPSSQWGQLGQVVGSACAISGSTIRSHAVLDVVLCDESIEVGSADQLTHVLVNLLLNAAESVHSAHAKKQDSSIQLRAFQADGEDQSLIIEVINSGPGIPEDLQARIFDPFFTTRRSGKATGLGLPICYSMVAAMGGELEVESGDGCGVTMRVRLPKDLGLDAAD